MCSQRCILIADDDADIRFGLQLRLSAMGFRTIEAVNGLDALELTATELPDLILMDIRMPVVDGLEALSRLKRGPSANIPVVMVSASPGDQTEALDVGARFFLSKPFTSDALVSVVRSALGNECVASANATAPQGDQPCQV